MSPLPAVRCLALLVGFLAAQEASADDVTWKPGERTASRVRGEIVASDDVREHDGVYGRFDGDLTLTFGLGVELDGSARGAALGRALYYHSAGVVLGYSDALGADDAALTRIGFVGLELRPLFLPRWALDLEFNTPTLDLALDSLAIGASFYRAGRDADAGGPKSGFELALGFGIPLCARAEGLWLEARGFLRPGLGDEAQGALFGLSYYGTLLTPLVTKD